MDSLEIPVLKPDGTTVTLNLAEKEAMKEVLQALADGGYVVLITGWPVVRRRDMAGRKKIGKAISR